jgi:septal ring factor EnvC (AmiA/AmiB activator)
MHHSRATDTDFPGVEHVRKTDTIEVANRFLGMPVTRALASAIGFLLVAVFSVWLSHDRAIAATQRDQKEAESRIQKLEEREAERNKTDTAIKEALTEIKTTLTDVKERVVRIENRQQGGK